MELLISVIVPVYNVENYIDKCLISLIEQTYSNIEIILVNDGSTDGTLNKLLYWENLDKRIKVINQINKGVSEARNNGIKVAQGHYTMFVDSDDWIDSNTLELCVNKLKEDSYDLILFGWYKEFYNHCSKDTYFFKEGNKVFSAEIVEIRRRTLGYLSHEIVNPVKTDIFNSPWGKLILTDLIKSNNLKFFDRSLVGMEDVLFSIQLYQFVSKPFLLNEYLYHYRQENPNSISKVDGLNLKARFLNLLNILENQFQNSNHLFHEALKNRTALLIINILLNINSVRRRVSLNNRFIDTYSLLNDAKFHAALKNLDTSFMPFAWKIIFFLCKHKVAFSVSLIFLLIQLYRSKFSI